MLPNEEFALACRAYYEEQGLIVDGTNGEFAHCPLPKGMGETGYYLLWEHHQQQGLLQSRDVGQRCFFNGDAKKWLKKCDYFPSNFFDLWDIYDTFSSPTEEQKLKLSVLSPEMRKKTNCNLRTAEAREKAIKTYRNTVEGWDIVRRKQMTCAAVKKRQKTIEITFPSGRVGVYYSLSFAALSLGVSSSRVNTWIGKGSIQRGDFKNYSARYV